MQVRQLLLCLLFIGCLFVKKSSAQTINPLPEWLTSDELSQIEKESDEESRIKVLLRIVTSRLKECRNNIASEKYEQAATEITHYGSLVQYTFDYIQALPRKEKDKKNICRKFELALRNDLKTLDSLRYLLPEKYAIKANNVYESVKSIREIALSVIFGPEFFRKSEYKPFKEIE